MFKVFISFIIYCVITICNIQSQNIDGFCNNVNLLGQSIKNNQIEFSKYKQIVRIKKKYTSFNEVKNKTVEELMKSQISVQNNEWLSYNFGKKMNWRDEQFTKIKNQDEQRNYIELVRKVTYSLEGINYSVLRINVYDEKRDKPIVITLMARQIEGRWIFIRNKSKSSIEFLLMSLNLEYLDALFERKKTGNSTFNKIIASSWNEKKLNIQKAYSEIGKKMIDNNEDTMSLFERNNPSKKYDSIFKSGIKNISLENININIKYIIPLENQEYCDYFYNEISEFNSKDIEDIIEVIKNKEQVDNTRDITFFPISKFKCRIRTNDLIFVKYSIQAPKGQKEIKVKVFDLKKGSFFKKNDLNNLEKKIHYILKTSKSEFINEISNAKNNPNYPEINKLKPLVKDANGVLNIDKLAKVIKDNKSLLFEYLDN